MKFKLFSVVALCGSLAVSACSTTSELPNIQYIKSDKFTPDITIAGAPIFVNPFGGVARVWFIISVINKNSGKVSHQIFVNVSYLGSWAFYESAADDTAQSLEVRSVDTSVNSCDLGICSLQETLGIPIDDTTLRQQAETGYDIKLSARYAEPLFIKITPSQIKLQLESVATNQPQSTPAPQPKKHSQKGS